MRGMTKSVIVLVSVCLISATMLGLTNFFTKDKIRDNELAATVEALEEVMNGEPVPMPLNLKGVKVNEIVTEVYKAKNGDVAVKMSTKGFKSGLVIMCGVDSDGRVINAVCLDDKETYGAEETYGERFKDKDLEGVGEVDTVGGATKTTSAYKEAIKIAIETAKLVKNIDIPVVISEDGGSENE
jgi:Na+-translocating ferredoxin:NAD+ oxidoreductase RnfG subunit